MYKSKIKSALYFIVNFYKLLFPKTVTKTVVVLGMHRSGTSMTAGVLNILGVGVGREYLIDFLPLKLIKLRQGESDANKKGHYENLVIQGLNKAIFQDTGCDRDCWDDPPSDASLQDAAHRYHKHIKRTIRFEEGGLWGWKDPRSVFTIKYFLPYLTNPVFIVCHRDPFDVARSLNTRNNMTLQKGRELARAYEDKITEFTENLPDEQLLELDFEEFKNNPTKVVTEIVDFLGIPVHTKQRMEAIQFVDPNISTWQAHKQTKT